MPLSKREGCRSCYSAPVIYCHVAMWASVARSSDFFFQEKPEIWNFMRNLPIFKSWQLIKNIFKTPCGPKKKSLPAELDGTPACDLCGKSQKVFVIYLALCSTHTELSAISQRHHALVPFFSSGVAILSARNVLLIL